MCDELLLSEHTEHTEDSDGSGNRTNAWHPPEAMQQTDGPVSVVFTLRTFEGRSIPPPRETGIAARRLFFDLLTRTDPNIADSLHNSWTVKPYTSSFLLTSRREPGLVRWRVCDLTGTLIPLLHRAAFMRSGPSMVDLCQVPARFESIAVSESHDRDAGSVSYARLAEAPIKDRFFVRFVSPFAFRNSGRYVSLFPNPLSLLRGASARWDIYSRQQPFGESVCHQIASRVSVHWVQLETVKVLGVNGIRHSAAIGEAIYRLEDGTDEMKRAFSVLFPFLRWCGIGWATGAGMGQVRIEDAK